MEHRKKKHKDHWSHELAVRAKGGRDVENKHGNNKN